MPMRFGEMVLVIRTQDYASRNLSRLSQNLGKLSKTQQLQRRLQTQGIAADKLAQRQNTLGRDIGLLRQRLQMEERLSDVVARRRQEARRLGNLERATTATGQLRGAGGRFEGLAAPHIAQASAEVKRLADAEKILKRQHAGLLDSIRQTRPALASMNSAKAVQELDRLEKELDLTSRRLRLVQSDIGVTQKAINQLRWDNVHRAGQAMSRAGRIMQLTGLIATGSLVAAGNAAAGFSDSVSLAATQTRDLNAPVAQATVRSKQLQAAILDMMHRFPSSAEEMSNAAYEIFSSLDLAENGAFNLGRGIRILELVNKAAVAGMTSLDDSMRGIVITFNNFAEAGEDGIISVQDVNRVLDDMFSIIRFGDVHMGELAQMMERVAPAAKGVGHNLRQISGPLALLTRLIGPGKTAAGFALLEQSFANRDFVRGMREAGAEIQQSTGELIPFVDIIEKLLQVEPGLATGQKTIEEFFKTITAAGRFARTGRVTEGQQFTIQARTAARALVQNWEELLEAQNNIINNKQEFDRALQARMQDPGVQWKIFLNSLRAVALEIGQSVLPALLGVAGAIRSLISWFRGLDPELKKNIAKWALWLSIGALVGGIALSIVGGFVSIVGAIALLSGSIGTGGTGVVGRLVALLGLLRALTLIGVITITISLVFQKTGLSNWIDEQAGKLENALDAAGIKGGAKIIGALRELDRMTGLVGDKQPPKQAFKPGERMFPGTKDMRTWGDMFPQATKAMEENGKKALDWKTIWKRSTKEVRAELAKDLGIKSLEDLSSMMQQNGKDAAGMADAISAAAEQAEQQIDQAAQRMTQIWEQFRQENAAAFGDLFSGPFFQSETWSLAEEWDVKPTMREINRDLKEQIQAFRKWRSTLAGISKRKGATPELMKELQALGPGAMKFLEVLRKGSPGAWNQFIGLWRTKQKEITRATQIDFDKQLKQWFKYGSNIAKQIILGLRSENVALDNAFKKYIINRFPGIVAQAEKDAAAAWRRQHPKAPGTGGAGSQAGSQGSSGSNRSGDNYTIIVHPREGETTLHALKRGAWEFANGGGRRGRKTPPKGAKVIVDPPTPTGRR